MFLENKRPPRLWMYFIAIAGTILLLITSICMLLMIFNYYHKGAMQDYFNIKNIQMLKSEPRLVCYYTIPNPEDNTNALKMSQVDAELCTHINIGVSSILNSSIYISKHFEKVLIEDIPKLRSKNEKLKLLLWVGGGGHSTEFSKMIVKHDTRKIFIKSLKQILQTYKLDGVDLDWEFPSAYNKERTHFSQLLYEIRQEFIREKRNYLLSIAVAAVEGIALFAYDIREINMYADYVNLMTYDYHFYSKSTPFTGLNAPLFAKDNERSILSTLNINYSINWWLSNGLEHEKLVVGLPTYGHSFTLYNPFNNGLEAPASGFGNCGQLGFTSYSDVCWFITHNVGIKTTFDSKTASPYLSSGSEWISFENETSIAIKARYIRSLNVGGIMAFSLNTDDTYGYCLQQASQNLEFSKEFNASKTPTFPLINVMKKYLFT